MSLWEAGVCMQGWNDFQAGDKPAPPSPEEYDDIIARFNAAETARLARGGRP